MQYIKDTIIWNNSLLQYLICLCAFLISIILMNIILIFLLNILKKLNDKLNNNTFLNKLVNDIKKRARPIIFIISISISRIGLKLPEEFITHLDKIVVVFVIIFSVIFISDCITNFTVNYLSDNKDVVVSDGIITILKVLVWIVGFLTILSNLGININTFITGFGIGGIAVAFAAQSIISDLFNYFVITFDKPFIKGDYIQIDKDSGTVEYIGIKSTRIRRNSGEQLLISNTNLLSSRIQNYRILEKRRRYVLIRVEYSTPLEKLKIIPDILKKIVEDIDSTEFYTARFVEFDDSSLNFELIYYVHIKNYDGFIAVVEDVNLKIIEEFNKLEVSFALPSRTLYVE